MIEVQNEKPVFLDLTKIHFPITAIASIFHRISGFIIFLLIPLLLWMAASASTASGFAHLQACLANPIAKLVLWGLLAALSYHLVAGIKHLLVDTHILGENLHTAKIASMSVFGISIILIIIAGVWVW